jgi:hypothetical protein
MWDSYERLMARILGIRSLGPDSLLRIRLITYHGLPLQAGDQKILSGMQVLELHLDSRRLIELGLTGRQTVRHMRQRWGQERTVLYHAVQKSYNQASGIVATTLLGSVLRDMGFHEEPMLPGLWHWWLAFYFRWLGKVYRPAEAAAGRRLRKRSPVIMWLTCTELERQVELRI